VHIISKQSLRAFWNVHPEAASALLHWHNVLAHAEAADFAMLKAIFNTADWVNGYVVFNVGGNKYRVIVKIVFRTQTAYIKHVLTHKEYDSWKP
jgi:mRNA interferase HigB